MTSTISRLYDSYPLAQQAVTDLEAAGLAHSNISIVANNSDDWHGKDGKSAGNGAKTGARVGAGLGGAAGLLTGLGLLAIPGVGPVVAAGWLVATAAGAAAGAATGGLVGVLTEAGISKEDAHVYSEGVRRGGTLVSAKVEDGSKSKYEAILNRSSVNITDRGAAYRKAGWQHFDPAAKPYDADQVRKERQVYSDIR